MIILWNVLLKCCFEVEVEVDVDVDVVVLVFGSYLVLLVISFQRSRVGMRSFLFFFL